MSSVAGRKKRGFTACRPRDIASATGCLVLFFHGFPVVPGGGFWHNGRMPKRAEKNAESSPPPVLPAANPEPVPAATSAQPRVPEIGGPSGPEPTRFGDWEQKGRCIDF